MAGKSQKIRIEQHLWGHLDGMASGMGANPDVLLERAVTTLLRLHGYAVERGAAGVEAHPVPTLGPTDATPPRPPAALQRLSVRLPPAPAPEPPALGAKTPTIATRVEGVDKKMPIITGVVSGFQPTIQAKNQGGTAEPRGNLPSTADPRAQKVVEPPPTPPDPEPSGPGLGDDADQEFPTQISMAHRVPEALGNKPQDSGSMPEPVAAGELVTGSRGAGDAPSATQFPTNPTDDGEAPFVSDVIAVPPELWASDSKLIVAPVVGTGVNPAVSELSREVERELGGETEGGEGQSETVASPEEFDGATTDAVPAALVQAMIQSGAGPKHQPPVPSAPPVHVESFTAPRSDLTPAHESFTAPRSDLTPALEPQSSATEVPLSQTHGLGSEATLGLSEQTQVPSEETHLSSSDATHGLSEETHLSSSDATHGLSVETHVSTPGVTVGLSEETQAPISELTPTADGVRGAEAETRGMDVPWEPGPAEASSPERGGLLPPPEAGRGPAPESESLPPPVAEAAEESPPLPPAPPPDADPARIAAAARIRAIAADLEKWVLPREDRPFSIDLPPAEKK